MLRSGRHSERNAGESGGEQKHQDLGHRHEEDGKGNESGESNGDRRNSGVATVKRARQ